MPVKELRILNTVNISVHMLFFSPKVLEIEFLDPIYNICHFTQAITIVFVVYVIICTCLLIK